MTALRTRSNFHRWASVEWLSVDGDAGNHITFGGNRGEKLYFRTGGRRRGRALSLCVCAAEWLVAERSETV
jgi:hypothetical protein